MDWVSIVEFALRSRIRLDPMTSEARSRVLSEIQKAGRSDLVADARFIIPLIRREGVRMSVRELLLNPHLKWFN